VEYFGQLDAKRLWSGRQQRCHSRIELVSRDR
jgi:hypothetical protein